MRCPGARSGVERWCRGGAPRAALLVLLVVGPGCGYTTGSLFPPGYRKVYVPLFENQTFYRDLEVELTRQVHEELATRPGIFIVPREEADIVLVGKIVDFRQRVISEDDRDRIRESSATTTVRIEIRDGRRPQRILKEYVVADRAEFFLARGENLATAQAESFFDLAREIVNGLEKELERTSTRQEAGDQSKDVADA